LANVAWTAAYAPEVGRRELMSTDASRLLPPMMTAETCNDEPLWWLRW
jgi:hypothetical protein